MILVDTGVWISFLRNDGRPVVTALAERVRDGATLATCEPVAMELLAGAGAQQLSRVERLVDGLPSLPLDAALDFRAAASIFRSVRASGHSPRSMIDCLVAALAIRHDAELLHDDVDFDRIAGCTGLRAIRS